MDHQSVTKVWCLGPRIESKTIGVISIPLIYLDYKIIIIYRSIGDIYTDI